MENAAQLQISPCLWLQSQGSRMPFPQVEFNQCVRSRLYSWHNRCHRGDEERLLALFLSPHRVCSLSVKLRPALSPADVNLFYLTLQMSEDLIHWQTMARICLGIAVQSVKKIKEEKMKPKEAKCWLFLWF